MELLQRQSSLSELARFAQEARDGAGRLVLVTGEAGVGKTTLVEQLQRDRPEARWSWGACDGLFTPRPLGPLLDLAGQLGGELPALCQAGAPREQLFGALLRRLSEPTGLDVVVMEDVHWADEATVDLLRFLGRRLQDATALLIVTYRDEDPSHPLRLALGDLAGLRSTRRITLAPLSADGVRQLAAGSSLDPAELYRLTGGNPFFVTGLLAAGLPEVPAAARDAVLARAARLSPQARELLDVAALIGTRIEPQLIEATSAGSAALVDEILASGLIAEDGPRLRFRHEIARMAAEQAIRTHRRGAIHARILAALRTLGCEDEGCSLFALDEDEAGVGKLREALRISISAGLEEQAGRAYANLHAGYCGRRRFAEADRWFTEAIAYCDEHDITTYSNCLRGERTSTLAMTGRWDEAASLCLQLLDNARASPVNRINPLTSLGLVRARRAEDGTWACLDEAAPAADASQEGPVVLAVRLACTEAYWLEGQPEIARRDRGAAVHLREDRRSPRFCRAGEAGRAQPRCRRGPRGAARASPRAANLGNPECKSG